MKDFEKEIKDFEKEIKDYLRQSLSQILLDDDYNIILRLIQKEIECAVKDIIGNGYINSLMFEVLKSRGIEL